MSVPPPDHRTCTWLSTDGGVTFKDVAEGSYIYEYADFGSTIIMAKHPGLMAAPASGCHKYDVSNRAGMLVKIAISGQSLMIYIPC